MKQPRIILSGGGTGGHIFPAVAIANEIKKIHPHAEILFVGALGRMEMEKVPAAGYKIIGVPIAGLQRKLTLANFKLPIMILRSLISTRKIIKEFKPDVAVGTGGYASGPLLKAAGGMGVPILIQEQNSYAGITNKILSKKAAKICVAYEGMEKFFPASKIMLTGNPVRQDLSKSVDAKQEAMSFFGADPGKKTLLVIGGSLGARTVNEAVLAALPLFEANGVQVLWQTGKTYYPGIKAQIEKTRPKNILAHEFISRMDLAYSAADLVISRAGASSVSELCNLGKPSVLIPSPNVAEDHQTKNAVALVKKSAAVLVKDEEAKERLGELAVGLLKNESELQALHKNILAMAHPDAARVIALEVLKLAGYPAS